MDAAEVTSKYWHRIFAACFEKLHDKVDAEDGAQEVCERLLRHYKGNEGGGWSYVRKVIDSVCADRLKARNREVASGAFDDEGGAIQCVAPQAAPLMEPAQEDALAESHECEGFGAQLMSALSHEELEELDKSIKTGDSGFKGQRSGAFEYYLGLIRDKGLPHDRAIETRLRCVKVVFDSDAWTSLQPLQKKAYLLSVIGLKNHKIRQIIGSTASTVSKSLSIANKRMAQ